MRRRSRAQDSWAEMRLQFEGRVSSPPPFCCLAICSYLRTTVFYMGYLMLEEGKWVSTKPGAQAHGHD